MTDHPAEPELGTEPVYTTAEVARMFRVDPKTVARWAAVGAIASIRTPGGQRRFKQSVVLHLMGTGNVAVAP
ncbi:BldC family transcriptional regulator [Herbidospora sp. NEAU-GS84]|uniref:BldC family transcriptional regulator n=1 Tax=Herbidospora solisilvae TaxID=2696284 RepID=A0A7C9JKH2_9ACTN|nr:BldC family transcriptional regulator [Herbidospora solisilvae]NAS27463.1 BldC family transcriptional regulator [Herbidospora solisilvae]